MKGMKMVVFLAVTAFLLGITADYSRAADTKQKGEAVKSIDREMKTNLVVLRWNIEEIGKPGLLFEPYWTGACRTKYGRPGIQISDKGILYIDVATPEGPKVYAIDVASGRILKTKRIKPGYYVLGISEKAVYLYSGLSGDNEVMALDIEDLETLWKDVYLEPTRFWITNKGVFYSDYADPRSAKIGILDETTGKPLWEKKLQWGDVIIRVDKALNYRHTGKGIEWEEADLVTGNIQKRKFPDWKIYPFPPYLPMKGYVALAKKQELGGGSRIFAVDINTGQLKWESEKLEMESPSIAEASDKVVIVYEESEHGETSYVHWYGIDVPSGKILWEKWAKEGDPLFIDGVHLSLVEIVNDRLLIHKRGSFDLILVDTRTGDVIGYLKNFFTGGEGTRITYKDMLIVGTENGLRGYQVR